MLAVKKRCESSFNCPKLCLCKYNLFLQSPRSAFENQIISVTMQEITEKIRNKSTKNLQSHLKCIKITKKSALCTAECTYHMAPLISHIFSLFFCSVIFAVLQLHLCRIYCRCAFFPLFFVSRHICGLLRRAWWISFFLKLKRIQPTIFWQPIFAGLFNHRKESSCAYYF